MCLSHFNGLACLIGYTCITWIILVIVIDVQLSYIENTNRRPAENEFDRLLAMQLANDLDSSRNLDEMVRVFEKSTTPVNESTGLVDDYGFNTFSDGIDSKLIVNCLLFDYRITIKYTMSIFYFEDQRHLILSNFFYKMCPALSFASSV